MKSKVLSLILALMLPLFGYSKESILKRVISIEIVETPVINILQTIEVLGKVQFSYNPEVIDEDRIVSLSIKEKTIEYGLSLIFDNSIRFKEVGTHIVLLKNETKAEIKVRKKEKSDYIFTGIITDIGEVGKIEKIQDTRAKIFCNYNVSEIELGTSICCDGVCLTVTDSGIEDHANWFTVDISSETISKTIIGDIDFGW